MLASGYSKRFTTNGTQYLYFAYSKGVPAGYSYEFTISSQLAFDLYISSGSDSNPNELNYQLAYRRQTYLKINSDAFPSLSTFTALIKVNGIDHYNTVFHQSPIIASFNFVKLPIALENKALK